MRSCGVCDLIGGVVQWGVIVAGTLYAAVVVAACVAWCVERVRG